MEKEKIITIALILVIVISVVLLMMTINSEDNLDNSLTSEESVSNQGQVQLTIIENSEIARGENE